MASNPMQRKSRNSFLLGVIVTLFIAGIVIALLFSSLKQKTEELNEELKAKKMVYVLNQDVKSGQEITEDMFSIKNVHFEAIPSNATSVAEVIDTWFLQTKEGEMVHRDKYGLYLERTDGNADTILEVMQNENAVIEDYKGEKIETGDSFVYVNGEVRKVSSNDKTIQDEYGAFLIDDKNEDIKTRVYIESSTDEYYIYKIDNSTMNMGNNKTRVKQYIEIKNVPVLAKVDMNANTVITPNLVVQSDEVVTDDVRSQEYSVIALPIDLMTDDYVDIRLMTPTGQDFIVASKLKIEVPMNNDGTYIADTIRVKLREDELLVLSSAIVEAYGLTGAKLYATKYVEAALQEAAIPTYVPNSAVTLQIQTNPNIIEIAKRELALRYSENAKKMRNEYLQSVINSSEDYTENVKSKLEESITNSSTLRKNYLDSLGN